MKICGTLVRPTCSAIAARTAGLPSTQTSSQSVTPRARSSALARAKVRLANGVVDGQTYYWSATENPASRRHAPDDAVRLLAPFDPLVWDRRRFEHLWAWAYRFEAYTPTAKRVRGYYALAAGALAHEMATSAVRRNMPDPVPVMVLARLAVDQRAQGRKLGASLLQDAVKRCALVSQHAGIRAVLVHALNDRAKQFYEHYGFQPSAIHPMTLLLRLQQS